MVYLNYKPLRLIYPEDEEKPLYIFGKTIAHIFTSHNNAIIQMQRYSCRRWSVRKVRPQRDSKND